MYALKVSGFSDEILSFLLHYGILVTVFIGKMDQIFEYRILDS